MGPIGLRAAYVTAWLSWQSSAALLTSIPMGMLYPGRAVTSGSSYPVRLLPLKFSAVLPTHQVKHKHQLSNPA